MLLEAKGLFEPKALYYFRVLKNWRRQMTMGVGPTPEITSYWGVALSDPRRTKGPIHLVVRIIAECGAQGSPTLWAVPRHGVLDILRDEDSVAVFRGMAVQDVWKDLARDRQGCQGT